MSITNASQQLTVERKIRNNLLCIAENSVPKAGNAEHGAEREVQSTR